MVESIELQGGPRGRLSIRAIAMPADTNPFGHIFGGWLMAQMDLAGGTHAIYRARGRVATVAADAMEFHAPVFIGDEVNCYTSVERVGTTSIAIRVEAWVRRHCSGDESQIKVTSARFTYVAIHDDYSKRPVPPEESGV